MAVQENTWNVANRMHSSKDSDNPALNHIITGADEIYDDDKEKKQSEINAETDATLAEHESRLNAYGDGKFETYEATDETTDVTDVLPATGTADTVYRVSNWDGTQYDTTTYSEYGWFNGAYKKLDVKSYGIDEIPTQGSKNFVKSDGIYEECVEADQVIGDPTGDWVISDAQSYVDNRINELRGGASPAFNTLKKLEDVYITLNGGNFVTVPNYASLPSPGSADTLYKVSSWDGTQVDATKYTEYAWNGSAYVLLAVRSQIDQVFDISEYNNATYNDLADALSGTSVPDGVKHGGMSVKFIQNVPNGDNKYVQCRYMGTSTANADFANVSNWKDIEQIELITGTEITATGNDDTVVVLYHADTIPNQKYFIKIISLDDSGISDGSNKLFVQNKTQTQSLLLVPKGSTETEFSFVAIDEQSYIKVRATQGTTVQVVYDGYILKNEERLKSDETILNDIIQEINGKELNGIGNGDTPVFLANFYPVNIGQTYSIKIVSLDESGVTDGKNVLYVQDSNYSHTLAKIVKGSGKTYVSFVATTSTIHVVCRATLSSSVDVIFDGESIKTENNTERIQNIETKQNNDENNISNLSKSIDGKQASALGEGDTVLVLLEVPTIAGHKYQIVITNIDDSGVTDGKNILFVQNSTYLKMLGKIEKGSTQRTLIFTAIDNKSYIKCRATQGTTVSIIYNGALSKLNLLEDEIIDINQQISIDELDKLPALSDIIQPLFGLSFARIITDWGFVGASYDSGQFEDYSTTPVSYVTDYSKSWGQIFCGINNVEGYNFSRGGQTAKGWCTEQSERAWYGAQNNPKKGYTIQLGGNDISTYDGGNPNAYPLGDPQTDIDFSDYNNNANTYCGWIAGVIQRIKSVAPLAPIFMLSINSRLADDHDVVGWNTALQAVISRCNTELGQVYYVNQFGYPDWRNSEIARRYLVGGHPNFAGYVYLAGMFNKLIDNTIREHIHDFRRIQFN